MEFKARPRGVFREVWTNLPFLFVHVLHSLATTAFRHYRRLSFVSSGIYKYVLGVTTWFWILLAYNFLRNRAVCFFRTKCDRYNRLGECHPVSIVSIETSIPLWVINENRKATLYVRCERKKLFIRICFPHKPGRHFFFLGFLKRGL